MSKSIKIKAKVTCIKCGHEKEEDMPQYASKIAYRCENCNTILAAKENACCIYCSYGDVSCPPVQRRELGII